MELNADLSDVRRPVGRRGVVVVTPQQPTLQPKTSNPRGAEPGQVGGEDESSHTRTPRGSTTIACSVALVAIYAARQPSALLSCELPRAASLRTVVFGSRSFISVARTDHGPRTVWSMEQPMPHAATPGIEKGCHHSCRCPAGGRRRVARAWVWRFVNSRLPRR